MKQKNLRAKFFCENCGAEVGAQARVCKMCGRFFSSVRCPNCGETGSAEKFEKGCPICGYAMDGSNVHFSYNQNKTKITTINKQEQKQNEKQNIKTRKKTNYEDNSLPLWIYLLTFFVLSILIFAIFKFIK